MSKISKIRVNKINRIYHHTVEGTRESHPSVHDLQSTTRLAESWMLQIMDTRMGFPCPFHNVVIDYFSPTPISTSFSCTKHSAMAPLPTITSCYWLRRDVIIYLALNDGAKMLSHPRVRYHRMRQHFPRRANFGYRSVSSGRK